MISACAVFVSVWAPAPPSSRYPIGMAIVNTSAAIRPIPSTLASTRASPTTISTMKVMSSRLSTA